MHRVKTMAVITAVTILLYAAVDWSYGRLFPIKPYASHPERLTLSAYVHEPYFSEEFVAESFLQPGGWETPEGTRIVVPRAYDGKFFHVDILGPTGLPYRRTINPVPRGKDVRTVLLLGGSTIYNSEVPDDLTLASQLARILNHRGPEKFWVLNAGVSSVNTTQERERLEIELARGLRPDIVISFNGINDVVQGVYFGSPAGVMFSGTQRNRLKEWLKATLPLNIYRTLRTETERVKTRSSPEHLANSARVMELSRATAEVYERNLRAMHEQAAQHGFRLCSVLQPHLLSTTFRERMADVAEVERLADATLPQSRAAFDEGYKALRIAVAHLRGQGIHAVDGSEVFRDKRENIFLDMAHVNSIGNRMLAEYLAELIRTECAPRRHDPVAALGARRLARRA